MDKGMRVTERWSINIEGLGCHDIVHYISTSTMGKAHKVARVHEAVKVV